MYRKYFFLSVLGIALTGCAASGAKHEALPPAASADAAAAPTAAPQPPLTTPPASAKRLVLNMSGPVAVTQLKDWPAFQEEWRATFSDHAKEAGVAFDVQKGEPRSTGETGTLLQVYVNDYRMVGIGARVFLAL